MWPYNMLMQIIITLDNTDFCLSRRNSTIKDDACSVVVVSCRLAKSNDETWHDDDDGDYDFPARSPVMVVLVVQQSTYISSLLFVS
jgi:hypothetical protein